QASCLAAPVHPTIAAVLEMNRGAEAAGDVDGTRRSLRLTASFSRVLLHLEALAAVLQHLRHQGQAFKSPVLVQRRKDLLLAPHLDPVSCPQRHGHLSFSGEFSAAYVSTFSCRPGIIAPRAPEPSSRSCSHVSPRNLRYCSALSRSARRPAGKTTSS